MIRSFRTYCSTPKPAATRQGGGAAEVRRCAERAGIVFGLTALFLLSFITPLTTAWAATPPGTDIDNTAVVIFQDFPVSPPRSTVSNTVTVTTVALRTTAVIEFLKYAPASPTNVISPTDYSTTATSGGPFVALPAPVLFPSGTPVNLGAPVPLTTGSTYHTGEPLFIRLTDLDQNLNPTVIETVLVTLGVSATGDGEVVRLSETGPDTGIFSGHIQTGPGPAANGNGVLSVDVSSRIDGTYVDVVDGTDTDTTAALVDPFGIVFDSSTGLPVDGASVSLIDAATSNPATVYGDDGISIYPATITSGGTATDSGGAVYTFPAGGYRFPFIQPGTYRLVVTPPSGYNAPSAVPTAVLQALPGGPFAIVAPGSRGEDFIVNPGPALQIDIPVDATGTGLWLQKTAAKATAAVGDFLPYTLTLENIDTVASVTGVTIDDRLPQGFRYRNGSARLDSAALADPVISADGQGLTFPLGTIGPGVSMKITYVAEVGAAARAGKATNTAVAAGLPAALSNTATATVQVTEDLFKSTATIVGRVIVDGCGKDKKSGEDGPAGIRIYREDGTFAVTDKNGMYHFAAVQPGTHVVQLDMATIPEMYEVVACEENTRFAGKASSQFVDLQGGSLWRADFHLKSKPRTTGEAGLELKSTLLNARSGKAKKNGKGKYDVVYSVPMYARSVPIRKLRLIIMLPTGVTYQRGTSRLDSATVHDPGIFDSVLTYPLGEKPADWKGTMQFSASVPAAGSAGDLVTRAFLIFDTPAAKGVKTPVADNSLDRYKGKKQWAVPDVVLNPKFATLKADLTRSDMRAVKKAAEELKKRNVTSITVIGHTDSNRIRPGASKEFPDNYALSRGRAKTVAKVIAALLDLTPDQITIIGKGPDEPMASNRTVKGRALNRRVELMVNRRYTSQWTAVKSDKVSSGLKSVATSGRRPGEEWPVEKPAKDGADNRTMPVYDATWIEQALPGTEWLWPAEGYYPPIPSVAIAIKHDPRRIVKLLLNGREVEGLYLDSTVKNRSGTVAVSRWRGIHVQEGENTFEVVEYDEQNAERAWIKRAIHYSTPPVKAVLAPELSNLVADGRTPPKLAIRLTDKDGHPAREGLIGEFSVDPPHLPFKRVERLQQSPLIESASEFLKYEVGVDGVALIELQPTMQSGEAVVRFPFSGNEQEVRAWLTPEVRDWILVGLAEGTVGYNTVRGKMENFGAGGGERHLTEDGRIAFYAKGRIKGEWLLTIAYDSARRQGRDPQGLYQTIDPNKYYLLYGDGTEQQHGATSAKSLYVKLERGRFYALFGDYPTGLTVTELSRYNRNLTGFKSEMKGERFAYTAFAADTNQAFVKDELRGDGTSGLYRLSRQGIMLNSERVVIETRDRFKSEVILSSQELSRHLDYSIDYEAGTIFFKQPVMSSDGSFNPITIVVEYETIDAANRSATYGGRGAVNLMENRAQIGATHVHEGRVGGSGNLVGLDASLDLGKGTTVRAEVATTKTEQTGTTTEGTAYLAEVTHRSAVLDGKVYVREQAPGFGLGQQAGSESGTRKVGADLTYRLNKPWSFGGEVFRQDNLSTGAMRDVAEVRGRYAASRHEFLGGLRHAEDTFPGSAVQRSTQMFFGGRYRMTERTTLRFNHEQSLAGNNDNGDYPTRTTLGTDYKLSRSATLFADQEWTHGSSQDSSSSRLGLRASPWTGGQISSTMEQQVTENGTRLFSTTGLKQVWQVNKTWSFDAGLDRTHTFRHPGNTPINVNVPAASGSTEDYTAVSLGAGYRQKTWSWTGRVERRVSTSEKKYGILMGASGEPRPGVALAGGLTLFQSDYATGTEIKTGDVRFGLVYRPRETRWTILDRLDYLVNEQTGGGSDYDSQRFVNNFVANYKSGKRVQVSFQYGAKYVLESIDSTDYSGYTDLTGVECRYDLTKKWDIGIRGSMLHSWSIDQKQYGSSVSTGFNVAKDFWVSVGYNITGFEDRDFSRAEFTSQGPFIKFRIKFDQLSVQAAAKWFAGL